MEATAAYPRILEVLSTEAEIEAAIGAYFTSARQGCRQVRRIAGLSRSPSARVIVITYGLRRSL
jgi:hypothetical protein